MFFSKQAEQQLVAHPKEMQALVRHRKLIASSKQAEQQLVAHPKEMQALVRHRKLIASIAMTRLLMRLECTM
jgi:hypothetical protein